MFLPLFDSCTIWLLHFLFLFIAYSPIPAVHRLPSRGCSLSHILPHPPRQVLAAQIQLPRPVAVSQRHNSWRLMIGLFISSTLMSLSWLYLGGVTSNI